MEFIAFHQISQFHNKFYVSDELNDIQDFVRDSYRVKIFVM